MEVRHDTTEDGSLRRKRAEGLWANEQDGTVQCRHPKCGTSGLKMVTTVVDGKKQYSVPEHKRRANPFRRRGVKKAPSYQRTSRRDSGRNR
jgi:hypothetical protein